MPFIIRENLKLERVIFFFCTFYLGELVLGNCCTPLKEFWALLFIYLFPFLSTVEQIKDTHLVLGLPVVGDRVWGAMQR